MNKEPQLAEYELTDKIVSTLDKINHSVQSQNKVLNNVLLFAIIVLGLVLFFICGPLFKTFGGVLFIAIIIVLIIVYGLGIGIINSSLKRHLTYLCNIQKISIDNFELWNSNNLKFNSAVKDYQKNVRQIKNGEIYKTQKITLEDFNKKDANAKKDELSHPNSTEIRDKQLLSHNAQISTSNVYDTDFIKSLDSLFSKIDLELPNHRTNKLFSSELITMDSKRDDLYHDESKKIGDLGELFIINYEKEKLLALNLGHLVDKIIHVSKDKGDRFGFDVLSYDDKGEKILIEVKTTLGDINSPFYITQNELSTRKSNENYLIYRVYNFNMQLKKGNIYVINYRNVVEDYFLIESSVYKMTPNNII